MSNKLDRRLFMTRLGTTADFGAIGIVTGTSPARALQITDSDGAPNAAPAGDGRGTN